MRIDRLELFLDRLKQVKADDSLNKYFDLRFWGFPADDGCHTFHCIAGWAGTDPRLQAQGYRWQVYPDQGEVGYGELVYQPEGAAGPVAWGMGAVVAFLELEYEQARYLFGFSAYPADADIDTAIARLESFITLNKEKTVE